MIKTAEFALSKKDYYVLVLKLYLRQRWWILTVLVVCLFLGGREMTVMVLVVALAIVLHVLLYYWQYVNRLARGLFMSPARMEFDDEFVSTYFQDGSLSRIRLTHIARVEGGARRFVIHHTSGQFQILPRSALGGPPEEKAFEEYLVAHKLRK